MAEVAHATICDNAWPMDNDLTPLGALFEAVRQAKRPKLSQNAVAKAARTSSTTYRRIISGTSRFGGQDVPFEGSADTVAQIARALGVTSEQLEEAGRTDAAEELRILHRETINDPHASPMDRAEALMDENEQMVQEIVARLRRLNRRKRQAVEQLIDVLEDDSPRETERP